MNNPFKAPVNVLGGGYIKQISYNPIDGGTWQSVGQTHEQGGMPIDSTGDGRPDAEIETNETIHQSPITSDKFVGGNLRIPGTKIKFKDAFKHIGKEEEKTEKFANKAKNLMEEANPENKYGVLTYNSGNVMSWSALNKQKQLAGNKEELAQLQEAIHQVADAAGTEPKNIANQMRNGGKINIPLPQARHGRTFRDVNDEQLVANVAKKYGIDEDVAQRLVFQESGYNPRATSGAGAAGLTQLMPATAAQYGITRQQLTSNDPKDKEKVVDAGMQYFKSMLGRYNNDYKLALAAYNAGPGTVDDFIKGSGKNRSEYTGDDLMARMKFKRDNTPSDDKSLAQNQTYDYINNIFGTTHDQFYGKNGLPSAGKQFNQEHYSQPENTWPKIETNRNPLADLNSVDRPISTNFNPTVTGLSAEQRNLLKNQQDKASFHPPMKKTSLADRNKLQPGQFLPEIMALADRPDFVPHESTTPTLFQPYNVSFQDRLNQNNASFKALQENSVNNPEALSILAAQKYAADNGVEADQFRTNQQISNEVTNKNIALINDAREKNLQLSDQQFVRQTQAKENTRANQRAAMNSIADKIGKNKYENNNIRLSENLFNFRPDQQYNMQNQNPDAFFHTPVVGNQMFNSGNPQYDPNNTVTYKLDENGQPVPVKIVDNPDRRTNKRYWAGGKVKNPFRK